MLSDIEIARKAHPLPIVTVAEKLGYSPDEVECYGKYKAKVPSAEGVKHGKRPLEIAGRQSAHHAEEHQKPHPRPEGGPPLAEPVGLHPPAHQGQRRHRRGGAQQDPQIQPEQTLHVSEVAAA